MIQEFQLRALPEQAISEQALKQFIGREKGLDIRTIHSIRVLKRSIDARQRTIYVNLKVRLYINEIPHDEEFVRTEVQFIPAKLKVIDHYRETYECRSCRKNGTPYMEKAPVPYPPVLHSLASASTITWLIHQKFELSIPLYRQEKEWEALGLRLSRATMSNWLLVVYRDWLNF